jgi:hypothetical protein
MTLDTNRKALGRYVDLRCIDGLDSRESFFQVRKEYDHKAAVWAQKAAQD